MNYYSAGMRLCFSNKERRGAIIVSFNEKIVICEIARILTHTNQDTYTRFLCDSDFCMFRDLESNKLFIFAPTRFREESKNTLKRLKPKSERFVRVIFRRLSCFSSFPFFYEHAQIKVAVRNFIRVAETSKSREEVARSRGVARSRATD